MVAQELSKVCPPLVASFDAPAALQGMGGTNEKGQPPKEQQAMMFLVPLSKMKTELGGKSSLQSQISQPP